MVHVHQIALVTGGASGIGRALCEALAERGATVVVADRDEPGAMRVAHALRVRGLRAEAVALDVTDHEQVREVIDGVLTDHGRIDLFINSAGIAVGGEVRHWERSHWERIVNVNLWGTISTATEVYRHMVGRRSGHIVTISSGAGVVPNPMRTAYATTKYAVVGFSTSLRHEAELYGVKVSVVCPGPVKTPIFDRVEVVGASAAHRDQVVSGVMTRNTWMTPQEAATVILRGVERNRAIITVTPLMAFLWRFYRLLPGLYERTFARLMVARDRKLLGGDSGPDAA